MPVQQLQHMNQLALTAHSQRRHSHETDPILGAHRANHVCIKTLRCMKPNWAYFNIHVRLFMDHVSTHPFGVHRDPILKINRLHRIG